MARTELPNGIILPAEYSDDWYDDMTSNLSKLDEVIGSDAEKLSAENVGAAALSNDYDDLDNKPDLNPYDQHLANTDIHVTVADKQKWNNGVSQAYVVRYASVAVSDNSSVPYTDLNNTDNIKANDLLLDTNGKLYQISSVDTANETVSVTTPLTVLALDGNVLHRSGNETKSGTMAFNNLVTFKNVTTYFNNELYPKGIPVTSAVNPYRIYFGSGMNYANAQFVIDTFINPDGSTYLLLRSSENVVSGGDTRLYIRYDTTRTQPKIVVIQGDILPVAPNTYTLGDSSFKFKQINGINPGALSFPDLDNGLDISGYITDLTGASNINKYTPLVNGWISVGLSNAEFIELYIPSALMGGTFTKSSTNNYAQAFMPVIANKEVRISLKGTSIGWAKFYPCQGNV